MAPMTLFKKSLVSTFTVCELENGPVEIVDLPINSMVIFPSVFCKRLPGRVSPRFPFFHSIDGTRFPYVPGGSCEETAAGSFQVASHPTQQWDIPDL